MQTSRIVLDALPLDHALTRRSMVGKLLGASAVAVSAVALGGLKRAGAQEAAAYTTQFKTTSALNLRSGPSTSDKVIVVMPAGAIVAHTGPVVNGFYEVGYGGTYGWAHGNFLAPYTGAPGDPVIIGWARTTASVNLRSGPSTGHKVLRVLAKHMPIQVSNTAQNGFRYVIHDGLAGWVADQFIELDLPGYGPNPNDPMVRTTTVSLNLRAEPSTNAKVLLVMPSGSKVVLLDGAANGFRKVTYKGTTGWAYASFLK